MKAEDGTGGRHPSWRCGIVTPPISFKYQEDLVEMRGLLRYIKKTVPAPQRAGEQLNNVFTRVAGGRAPTHSENPVEGVVNTSTYEELSLIISTALLVVAILNLR